MLRGRYMIHGTVCVLCMHIRYYKRLKIITNFDPSTRNFPIFDLSTMCVYIPKLFKFKFK